MYLKEDTLYPDHYSLARTAARYTSRTGSTFRQPPHFHRLGGQISGLACSALNISVVVSVRPLPASNLALDFQSIWSGAGAVCDVISWNGSAWHLDCRAIWQDNTWIIHRETCTHYDRSEVDAPTAGEHGTPESGVVPRTRRHASPVRALLSW